MSVISFNTEQDNIFGISYLYFIDINYIAYIPEPIDDILPIADDPIIFKDGFSDNDFIEIEFSQNTCYFTEKEELVKGDSVYSSKIVGFIAKDDKEKAEKIAKFRGRRFFVQFMDANGSVKAMGNVDCPCIFNLEDRKTGESESEVNGIIIQFSWQNRHKVPTLI